MKNPNKIHTVDIITSRKYNFKIPAVISVIINQEDQEGNVTPFYEIKTTPYQLQSFKTDVNRGYVDIYDVKVHNPKRQANPNVPLQFTKKIPEGTMDNFIDKLIRYFERGRYLMSDRLWGLPDAISRHLSYRHIKRILTFEKNATRYVNDKHIAIRKADPTEVPEALDCGDYVLEAYGLPHNRSSYACISFDERAIQWVDSMKPY